MVQARRGEQYARGAAMSRDEAVTFALDTCNRILDLEGPSASGSVS
jgi:hypothetical protein